MRKNRFLLNLIAATAIGLSAVGCGTSSSSGAIGNTTDITVGASENAALEASRLREYMIVAQRGSAAVDVVPGAGQSIPASVNADRVFAGSADQVIDEARALLYEFIGISDRPQPNLNILGPAGGAATSPLVDGSTQNDGTTGYHVMEADPTGQFAIGISRNRGNTAAQTQIQIFAIEVSPLDVSFPPTVTFENTASVLPILFFDQPSTDQGEFVAGAWSATGRQFYASINDQVFTIPVNIGTGAFDIPNITAVPFPAGATGRNNAVKFLNTADGRFVYAIDNANNQIVRWDREIGTGALSNVTTIPTVDDPRGATLDRSGTYMYVSGRDSGALAGYRVGDDGSLTPIEVFTGLGTAPANFGFRLGDVDANPTIDQVILASYEGLLQSYGVDPATGALTVQGSGGTLVGGASNVANIEVEPTGRFVIAASESGLEDPGPSRFLNLDSATNAGAENSATAQTDANGNTAFFLPEGQTTTSVAAGGIQGFSIGADGTLNFVSTAEAQNPYGLSFFQKVLIPPSEALPGIQPPPPVIPTGPQA